MNQNNFDVSCIFSMLKHCFLLGCNVVKMHFDSSKTGSSAIYSSAALTFPNAGNEMKAEVCYYL